MYDEHFMFFSCQSAEQTHAFLFELTITVVLYLCVKECFAAIISLVA